jgi:transposase
MFIGIDISKKTITCSLLTTPQKLCFYGETFFNTESGFQQLITRVSGYADPDACHFVTENTGVYGERLYYFCYRHDLKVYREPAHYIRRAFRLKRKTDPIDSRMIAEYGYRYSDQLHRWTPPDPLVEELQILMSNRDLFQRELVAHHNILKALGQKERADFQTRHQEAKRFLNDQITHLDQQMLALVKTNPEMYQHCVNLDTIPGVGMGFAINFLILTEGFTQVDYRELAGYLGIVPYEFESGESVHKKPRSDKKGPDRMRKQLYISVMASFKCQGGGPFMPYLTRKKAAGKPGKVVMNNLENKLLRMACAVVLGRKPYDKNFKSLRQL